MAAIDYTIPGQFKGIQIESPMNAMTQAMQLRNLQESSEINALKRQEYARAREEENALRTLFASGVKPDSDEFRNQLYARAPGLAPGIEKNILDRGKAASEIRYKDAQASAQAAETLSKKLDFHQKVFNPLAVTTEDQAAAHAAAFYDNPDFAPYATKMMTREQAIAKSRELFRTDKNAWLKSQLTLSGDKILEATERREKELRESAEKSYPAYQLAEFEAGREPLLIDQYVAQRTGGATAAPVLAPTTATASTPAPEMVGGTGEMVTLPDGTKQTPETVKTDKKQPSAFGADVHPLVPTLIAGGNKDMATIVQEGHKASGALRQINDTFKEIERLETEKPKGYEARIKALRDYIKVVSTEGPGTRVQVGVKLSEQEKGFEGDLGKGQAKRVLEDKDKAEDARDMLSTVNIGRDILKSGAITGAGADFFVGFNQALKTAGIDAGYADASANSQAYSATMAQNVGKLIKLFGAGTGLSDADRAYAEKMAGGKIALDRKALEKILDITERASRNVIKRYNKNVKGIKTNIPLEVELEDEVAPTPASPRKAPAPYSDAEKERRYQEWKAKQKGNKP